MKVLESMHTWRSFVLGVTVGSLLAAGPAAALVIRQPLGNTGVDADAKGSARLVVKGRGARRHATLIVKAGGLADDARFDVTVDGRRIGSLTTSKRGRGRAAFTTRPRAGVQRLDVDPRGRDLGIAGETGAVLVSRVDDRGLDPNDVRCCLPDDSGTECEDRTAAECAAAGGTDLGSGSCLPNPCATSTTLPGSGSPSARVTCERRASRSKISVDGRDLGAGLYRAEARSGSNVATSGLAAAAGGEAEFDFDSDPGDVAAGATAVAAAFITGDPPSVRGRILDAGGGLVAEATATCDVR